MSEPVLILGGSSDIAVALIERLLAQGTEVVAQCLSGANRLPSHPCLHVEVTDLADRAAVDGFVERFRSAYGTPSAVLQLAGAKLRLERFAKWDQDHVERDLQIQLLSTARVLSACLPDMSKLPNAHVIFVLSSVTRAAPKFMSMYTVVKSAQLGLMRALVAEYPAVHINAVSPSMVATRFLSAVPAIAVEMAAAQAPGGQLLQPIDVADAIVALLAETRSGVEVIVERAAPNGI